MRFSSWPFLFLILLIPLFFRWWYKRNQPPRIYYSISMDQKFTRKNPIRLKLLLRCLGLVFLVLALAKPQSSFHQMERTVSGIDIMLVLDVSASMNIEDLSEKSRLDVAKETMEAFIKGRQNDRIGFVIFSGEPLTLSPPTLDYGIVMKAVRDVEIGVLKDGTAIGDGLSMAVGRLRDSKAKTRVVILLTDGENNLGQVDPVTAGELAAGYKIRVYTVAIGKEGRVLLPIKERGPGGQVTVRRIPFENQLNVELLQEIAKTTEGKFYRVTDASTLDSVFSEIDHFERSEVKSNEKVKYEDLFHKPLKLAFGLLLLEQVLSLTLWRTLI